MTAGGGAVAPRALFLKRGGWVSFQWGHVTGFHGALGEIPSHDRRCFLVLEGNDAFFSLGYGHR